MSRTIDEKVVEMKFDNSDFEKGVSQSMSTIDKLKNALNFSDAESSFAPLESALEGVGKKFSAFETMAVGALLNIGGKIEDFVEKQVKSLTIEPITEGFDKYAKKTSSVQMIMNATGKEIEEVSNQLERLNWYTDETSYDFTEMVASIGKFTSAGIELDAAVTAMEGIANWAGVSGASKMEANRAMYNISQALAGGYMRLQDWKSIENANMATKEFKETVIQMAIDMGTLEEAIDDTGKAIYGFVNDSGDFEEVNFQTMAGTLTKGKWLTNDVLNATLAIYGAFTDELSKVYDDMNETVDITTSEIIGYVNQYIDNTIDWSEATEATGKSAEELEAILASLGREEYALGRKSFAAAQEAKTFQEAIDATKDAVSTGWMNTFEILFGNYDEAKVLWTDLANELWDIFAGPISDMNEMLTEWADPEGFGGRELLIESIKNIYRGIRSLVDPIAEAWEKIFPSLDAEGLFKLTEKFNAFTESLILSEDHMYDIRILFESIFGVIKLVKDGVGELIDAFAGGLKRNKKGFFEGIWDSIHNASVKLDEFRDGVQKVRDRLDNFRAKITSQEDIDRLKEAEPVLYTIVDIFEKLKSSAEIIGGLVGRSYNLKNIFSEYKEAGEGFAGVTKVISDRWTDTLKTVQQLVQEWTGINIGSVTTPIIEAIEYVQSKIEEIQKSGILGEIKGKISDIATEFEKNFGKISSWFEPLADAGRSIWTDFVDGIKMLVGADTSGTAGFFDSIKKGLDSIKEFIATNPELKTTIETFKDVIKIFADFLADFLSLSGAIEKYQEAGGGVNGILTAINDKLSSIFELVSDIIYRITGFDISKIGGVAITVVKAIEEGFAHLGNFIANLFGWENNPFAKFLGTSESVLDPFFEKLKSLTSLGKDGEGSFSISGIFDAISGAFSKFGEVFQKFSPAISKGIEIVGNGIRWIIDVLKDVSFDDLLNTAKVIVLIRLGLQLSNVFASISDAFWAVEKSLKAEAIKDIAFAIVAVAGAAVLVSQIDAAKMYETIAVLTAGMLSLAIVLKASQKVSAKQLLSIPGIFLAAAAAMIAFGVAVKIITGAIKDASAIKWDDLKNGLSAVGAAVGALILALVAASIFSIRMKGTSKVFSSFATALLLMYFAISAYSGLDKDIMDDALDKIRNILDKLGTAIALMAGIPAVLGMISTVLSMVGKRKFNFGKTMLDIATGILILVAAIAVVNLIDFESFAEGLIKILASILSLSVVIGFASIFSSGLEKFSSALLKFGKAILIVMAVVAGVGIIVTIFKDFATEIIDTGIDFINDFLAKLSEKAPEISDSLVNILLSALNAIAARSDEIVSAIMTIVVSILTQVGSALQNVDPEPFITGAAFIAGIIAAMFGIKKLGGIGLKDFVKIGGTILGAIAIFVTIIAALAGLGLAINAAKDQLGWDIVGSITTLGEVLDAVWSVITNKVVLLVTGLIAVGTVISAATSKAGEGKSKFNWGGLKGVASFILEIIAVVAEIVALMAALAGAVALINRGQSGQLLESIAFVSEVLTAIADTFAGSVGVMVLAIGVIVGLVNNLTSVLGGSMEGFASVSGLVLEIFAIIAEVVIGFTALGEAFMAIDKVLNWLNGLGDWTGRKDEDKGMIGMIKYFGEVLDAMAEVFGGVIGRFIGSIVGSAVGETFEQSAQGYAKAMVTICETMSSIPDDVVAKATIVSNMFSTLMAAIPNEGGFMQDLLGSKDTGIDNISANLPKLATAFNDFSTNLGDFDPKAVEDSKAGIDIILAIANAVPRSGGLWQWIIGDVGKGMESLHNNLKDFAIALVDYSLNIDGIDPKAVEDSESAVRIVLSIAKAVPKEGGLWQRLIGSSGDGMGSLKENLPLLAKGLVRYSQIMSQFKTGAVALSDLGVKIILKMANEVPKSGGFLDKVFGSADEGMSDLAENLPSLGEALRKYSESMKDFKPEAVESTAQAMGIIDQISNTVPKTGGFFDFLTADEFGGMKDITTYLPPLGEAFATFSTHVSRVSDDVVKKTGFALSTVNNINNMKESAESISKFSEHIKKYYNNIKGIDTSKMEQVADVVSRTWNLMFNVAKGTVGVDYMQQYNNLGELSMEGYAKGVITGSQKVMDATSSVMNSGIDTARRTLEVQSPSRVFMRIGEYVSEGLAIGITDGIGMVVESTAEMANAMTDEAKDILGIHSPSDVWYWIGQMVEKGFSGGLFDGKTDILNTIHGVMDSILNGASFDEVKKLFENSGIDTASLFGEGFYDTMKEKWDLGSMMEGADITGSMDEMKKEYESAMKDVTGSVDIENPMAEMQNEYTDFDWMNSIYDNNGEGAQEFVNTYMGNAGAGGADAYVDSSISTLQDAAPKYKEAGMELSTETSEGMVTAAPEGAEKLTEAYQESLDNSGGLDIGATTTISLGQAKSALEVLDRYFDGLKASIHEIKNQMIEEAEEGADAYVESTTAGVRVAEEKTEEARDAVSEATIDGAEGVLDVVKEKAENTEIEGPTLTLVVNADQAKDELEKTIKGLERKGIAVSVVSDPNDIPEDGNVMYYKMTEDERRELEQKRAAGLTDSASKTTAEITQDEVQNAWTGHSLRIASQLEQVDIYSRQLGSTMETVVEKLDEIKESNANTNVYLDGNIMVGAMANRMDRVIGTKATLAGRRV